MVSRRGVVVAAACGVSACGVLLGVSEDAPAPDAPPPATPGGGDAGVAVGEDGASDVLQDAAAEDARPLVVFVTSTQTSGDLGGLAGADAICNNLAGDSGLAGRFVAFLGAAGREPEARLPEAGTWPRVDGLLAFDGSVTALPELPVEVDESGRSIAQGARAWTGAKIGLSVTCEDWTSKFGEPGTIGLPQSKDGTWRLMSPSEPCDLQRRLYCFEVP